MPRLNKYHLKTYLNNSEVKTYFSTKQKRILYKVREANKLGVKKFYLKVTYGEIVDGNNKTIKLVNEGVFRNLNDFYLAWSALSAT